MAVGQRVENGFSLPAAFHQSALLENPKLVGHGALIHADQLGEIADAQLARFAEQHDDGEPRFVGEGFEELERVEHGRTLWVVITYSLNHICLVRRMEEGEIRLVVKLKKSPGIANEL